MFLISKVSVIVPIYNAGNRLKKCIKSILNQSFTDFELILVNDGSTDNSKNICEKFKNMDSRIVLINKENQGSIAARKDGINASSSYYIMFVDADDWLDILAIETLYNETIKDNVDVTVANMWRSLGNGKLINKNVESWFFKETKMYNDEEIKNKIVTAYFHGHPFPSSLCAKLYKKELLINNDNLLKDIKFLGDDLFYNMEVLLKSKKVKIINKSVYFYRVGGFTSKFQPHLFNDMINGYKIQKKIIDEFYQDSLQEQYNGISVMLLNTFKTCLMNLFKSNLKEDEIKSLIKQYTLNNVVRKCIKNEKALKYFPKEFINSIVNNNEEYLFNLGKENFNKHRIKNYLFNIIAKIA